VEHELWVEAEIFADSETARVVLRVFSKMLALHKNDTEKENFIEIRKNTEVAIHFKS